MKLCAKINKSVTIAFSGGIDSVFATDFCLRGKKEVTLAYFNHATQHGKKAESFAIEYANKNNLKIILGSLEEEVPSGVSKEAFWREKRYCFLNSIEGQVITCHHLDDVLETWIFSSAHGKPSLIPKQNKNVTRPFLLFRKDEIRKWATEKNLSWIEDESNKDISFCRNRIRHNVIPEILKVNPGVYKTMKKLINSNYE